MLVLGLSIFDGFMGKKGCKQGMIRNNSSYYIKLVFALLIEVIAVYIQFSIVKIEKLSF